MPEPDATTVRLSDLTTLRLGGPADRFVEATSQEALLDVVRRCDEAGEPLLVVGGGSNLVVADEGFPGTVVRVATTGVRTEGDDLTVAAGEPWDGLVAHAVEQGRIGIEALSGIPGSVGATPIQNVGAYGQEVAQTITQVRTWDRLERVLRTFGADDCGFSYRHSRFKADPQRHLVLDVTFRLPRGSLGAPVAYAELARTLGVEPGARAPLPDVRRTVLALRARKGMVLDEADHDTWSAGSFFTNPLLTVEQAAALPADAPRWEQPDGRVKSSAAWLIEHAGFGKGHGLEVRDGRVSLSTKHTLALTNRGGASTADLLELAREVRDGVEASYGVRLVNEPVTVGCAL